jgi:hypothetical protein
VLLVPAGDAVLEAASFAADGLCSSISSSPPSSAGILLLIFLIFAAKKPSMF